VRMAHSIPILFTVTAGFAVTGLSSSGVPQSPVLADPPVAYFRLGEEPGCIIAVDLSEIARDEVSERTSGWKVLKWDAPFSIEAWSQLIDDYHASKIFDKVKPGTGSGYRVGSSPPTAGLSDATGFAVLTPFRDYLSQARGVLGKVSIPNFAPGPAREKAGYSVATVYETGALTSLIGLVLILFGSISGGWRGPLNFRGSDAGLSRPGILQVGVVKLRKRSEPELNSFSARYATIEVRGEAPLAACGVPVVLLRP
jgi:hypothetical protein